MDISNTIKTLESLLADFNKHTALSVDLTNSEVEAVKSAIFKRIIIELKSLFYRN